MSGATDFERIGGEPGLRRVVTAFIDRVFDDFIIGFLFVGKDKQRIIDREIEFASTHMGGDLVYQGRPLSRLHKAQKINQGHFRRRLAILKTVLREHGVDQDIIDRWIAHNQSMEPHITTGRDCVEEG